MQIKQTFSKLSGENAKIVILAIIAFVLAAGLNQRWTLKDWRTPIEYGVDGPACDVKSLFTGVKSAAQGHFIPFLPKREPQLGAPYIANWDDYPCTEQFHVLIGGILAKFFGVFGAVNLMAVMSHVLAVLGFYLACRILKYQWEWSAVGALLFGFSAYIFARSEHHLTVAYVAHIPLVILVFRWAIAGAFVSENSGTVRRTVPSGNAEDATPETAAGLLDNTRFMWALGIAVFTGLNHVYYTNMLVQFVGLACLYQVFHKRWAPARRAALVAVCGLAAFILININSFWASHVHGPNPVAVSRTFYFLEYSGFKLADLFIPSPQHWIPAVGRWSERLSAENSLKGEVPLGSYIGIAGMAAFLWLAGRSIRTAIQPAFRRPPWEALLIAWVFVYATVGGLNCWVGSLGFILFRSSTRYSIYILALVLMFAVRRLGTITAPWGGRQRTVLALSVLLLGLWDQVPRGMNENQDAVAQAVASDRTFTQQMESKLKPNSMVFQLPIMNYPESPAPGIPPYDHFRPYLYAKSLRFSFGDVKGRPQSGWQAELGLLQPAALMERLESYGFGAIYVNLGGFTDHGKSYLEEASTRGAAVIYSPMADLACIFLKLSASPVAPPALPYFGKGWYELESDGSGRQQRLCHGTGELILTNNSGSTVERYITCVLAGMDSRAVRIANGTSVLGETAIKAGQGARVQKKVVLQPGQNVFTFSSDHMSIPTMRGPVDFAIVNFLLTDSPPSAD